MKALSVGFGLSPGLVWSLWSVWFGSGTGTGTGTGTGWKVGRVAGWLQKTPCLVLFASCYIVNLSILCNLLLQLSYLFFKRMYVVEF